VKQYQQSGYLAVMLQFLSNIPAFLSLLMSSQKLVDTVSANEFSHLEIWNPSTGRTFNKYQK
jgi:hypothetical protein